MFHQFCGNQCKHENMHKVSLRINLENMKKIMTFFVFSCFRDKRVLSFPAFPGWV